MHDDIISSMEFDIQIINRDLLILQILTTGQIQQVLQLWQYRIRMHQHKFDQFIKSQRTNSQLTSPQKDFGIQGPNQTPSDSHSYQQNQQKRALEQKTQRKTKPIKKAIAKQKNSPKKYPQEHENKEKNQTVNDRHSQTKEIQKDQTQKQQLSISIDGWFTSRDRSIHINNQRQNQNEVLMNYHIQMDFHNQMEISDNLNEKTVRKYYGKRLQSEFDVHSDNQEKVESQHGNGQQKVDMQEHNAPLVLNHTRSQNMSVIQTILNQRPQLAIFPFNPIPSVYPLAIPEYFNTQIQQNSGLVSFQMARLGDLVIAPINLQQLHYQQLIHNDFSWMDEFNFDAIFDSPDPDFSEEANVANYESEKDDQGEKALIEIREMENQARRLLKKIRALKSKKSTSNKGMDWFLKKNQIYDCERLPQGIFQQNESCPICLQSFIISANQQDINANDQKEKQEHKDLSSQEPKLSPSQQIVASLKQITQQVEKLSQPELKKIIRLYCSHTFHKQCVQKWLKQNRAKCPLCRKDFRKHEEYKKWDRKYKHRII